jgi:hypothetical protein
MLKAIADGATGHLVHHWSIWSRSVVASLKPRARTPVVERST